MILLEFPAIAGPHAEPHRHVIRLEDIREVVEMEDGRASIRIEGRERPVVVAQTVDEVMGRIHEIFQQLSARRPPSTNGQIALPNGIQFRQ